MAFLKKAACLITGSYILLSAPGSVHSGNLFISKQACFDGDKISIKTNSPEVKTPKIGLVLSGGGARGLAHIGVLEVLESQHIPIDLIVGTSIGSLIGGLYASGYSCDEIKSIINAVDWDDIYRDETQRTTLFPSQKNEQDRYLFSLRFKGLNPYIPPSFSPGQKVLSILSDLFLKAKYQGRNNFDNLKIPFRAITTDLVSGKLIALNNGNLAEAINASLAVPLLFAPVAIDSMLLVDGGLISNLPVDIALQQGAEITIAVDATARLRKKDEISAPWEIVDQATTIMSAFSEENQKKKADILIEPELGDIPNDQFSDLQEIVDLGISATEKQIPNLKDLLRNHSFSNNRYIHIDSVIYDIDEPALPVDVYRMINILPDSDLTNQDLVNRIDAVMQTGQFESVNVTNDSISGKAVLDFRLKTFAEVQSIKIQGNHVINESEIQSILFSNPGNKLNINTVNEDLERILELYREAGYSLASIADVSWDDYDGILTIVIEEGKIDRIRILGNNYTRDYVILREFNFQKNHVFNWRPVGQAIQNSYATNLFDKVNVDISSDSSNNELQVKVREKSPYVMHFGGKYDSDRLIQAYVEFGHENLFGMGIRANLLSRMGMRDGNIGLRILDDRIFTTNFTFSIRTYYTWEINPYNISDRIIGRYREERKGIRFQVGTQIRRLGQLAAEIRQENVIDSRNTGIFYNQQNSEIRTLVIQALSDKRDRIDFPTKGIYNHWLWESGNRLLFESSESFTKIMINLEGYYTFGSVHTWHLKMFFGLGDRTLPFSENFRVGGLHNFIGMHENEYFGKQLVTSSVEYRFRTPFRIGRNNLLFDDIYLLLRYDFGGVWNDPELLFTSDDFFSSVGGAIGVDTFLGPLFIGYGRTTRGEDAGYVSLGFNF